MNTLSRGNQVRELIDHETNADNVVRGYQRHAKNITLCWGGIGYKLGPPVTDRGPHCRNWLTVDKNVDRVLISNTGISGLEGINGKCIDATCWRSKRTLNHRVIACRNTGSAVGVSNDKTVILGCKREVTKRQIGNRRIRTGIRIERRVINNDIVVGSRPKGVRRGDG